jgi:hypothetical protein
MSKLLPNLPIEDLKPENDYIGIIEKGTLLKSFFLNNKHEFSQIKIFSIYGEWGSGKSTLMKYLEKELKGSFNTFFFESWEFESDNNLANSLLEFLTKKTDSNTDELLKNGSRLLEGFAKSVTFKTPFANFNMDKMIGEVDKTSFLERKGQFKKDFRNWEDRITKEDKSPDYNIIFIDDLDRCEPENILNLLSAMKLFFTYGKKTIFLCGIDKKAIREAVKTKYGEIVKANEYLEKIFDISFSMPEEVNTSKLISQYFVEDEVVGKEKLGDLISDFFDQLHFRNPRRIKKILNKYLIIKNLKGNKNSENLMLPNIIQNNSGTLFETYLTLYLLILNEFEPEYFKTIFNLSIKRVSFMNALKNTYASDNNGYVNAASSTIQILYEDAVTEKIKDISKNYMNISLELILVAIFSPSSVDSLVKDVFSNASNFVRGFGTKKRTVAYYFTLFFLQNWKTIYLDTVKIEFSLSEYKKMISNLL